MNYLKIFIIISMATLIFSTEKLFVACEGPYYNNGQGSISVVTDLNEITSIPNLGNTVQSLIVYEDKLFVISNGSHQIHIFEINENGQELIHTIDTNGSGPRNMVIHNDIAYFTNWNSMDIKVMDINNWQIINTIAIDGLPEDIISDGENIWVSVPMKSDWSGNNIVIKINPENIANMTEYEVGEGPGDLIYHNNSIYVSRTFYDENWNAFSGTSKIDMDGNINIMNYGNGVACGGSVTKHNNTVYRSYDGGIAPLDENLNIMSDQKIGNFNFNNLYDVKSINNKIYFALTNYADINQVTVLDELGNELNTFNVGFIPTDFAIWDNTVLTNNHKNNLISDFSISNAYPNPFNPSTNFELNISKSGPVSVKVFDLQGNVIDVLANDFYNIGSYMITWDAKNVTSGLYILNAKLNDKSISQRITLIK